MKFLAEKCSVICKSICFLLFLSVLTGGSASAYVPVIDPGHGGEDGGAVSDTGVVESGLNLEVSMKLKYLFCLFGIDPVMVRETDISLHSGGADTIREKKVSDLKNRVEMIDKVENALLLSIHQNTFPESRYSGAHVFFTSDESKPFAELLQKRIKEVLDPGNNREAKKVPSGVYLLNHVKCPAVLVECGFMTNPRELSLLTDPSYQLKLASVITSVYFDFVNGKWQAE
jgi:N-acetylmuramoyl-L-alanine amidase